MHVCVHGIYVGLCQCVCQGLSSAETVCTGGSDGDCYPCHIPLDDICTCVCVSVEVGGSCQHHPPHVHSHPGQKQPPSAGGTQTPTLRKIQGEKYTEMDALTDTEATGHIFPRQLIKIGCFHLLSEKTGFFLYNLIDSSSEEEVQAQAEKLKTYFTQLKTQVHNDKGDTTK